MLLRSNWSFAKMSDVQAENANIQLMQLIEGRNALNWWILELVGPYQTIPYYTAYYTARTIPYRGTIPWDHTVGSYPNALNWWILRLQLQLCTLYNLSMIHITLMTSTRYWAQWNNMLEKFKQWWEDSAGCTLVIWSWSLERWSFW